MATLPTLRDSLLPVLDLVDSINGMLGMRRHTVSILTRTWQGQRPGQGPHVDVLTTLYINGQYNPSVTQVSTREIAASGGLYRNEDIKVGPFVPPYPGSKNNTDHEAIDPEVGTAGVEIFWKVTGSEYGGSVGAWFKKISIDKTQPLQFSFVLRKTGKIP